MSAPAVQEAWAERIRREAYEDGYRDAVAGIRPRPRLREDVCAAYWQGYRAGEKAAKGKGR